LLPLALLALASISLAQTSAPQSPASPALTSPQLEETDKEAPELALPLEKWGESNPNCLEWTNQCQICSRKEGSAPQCSLPGIACLPGPPMCNVYKAKP
jgi:hypothetical protein